MKRIICCLFVSIFFCSASVFAADYHVSTSGSDSSGNGSESNPFRTPEYGAKQLSPGDRLIIHAGTYTLSQSNLPSGQSSMDRGRALVSPPNRVDGTAANPFVIMAAGDGTVLLDAGSNPDWPAVGSNYGDYVIIDGVSVRGAATFMWSNYHVIKNSDLYGGIDTPFENGGDYFGCVLRVEGCTGCLIQNNRMHDNQLGHTLLNSPLLMEYDSTDLIIENNDIYNSVGVGIRLKDDPETVTVRYNHIYDNNYSGLQGANQDQGNNLYIYQNIFRNNNTSGNSEYGAISGLVLLSNWYIYNNTFYGNKVADFRIKYTSILNVNAWNNIHSQSRYFYQTGFSSSGTTLSTSFTYSNYNMFHTGDGWRDQSKTYSSLSSFTATGFDTNSITTNPGFINAGGTSPDDYKRTSYPGNGRGDSYASVMGAFITGNEVIGYNSGGQKSGGAELSVPQGFQITN